MRSITKYLFWGSVVVMAAYLIATFGVQVAVPGQDQGNPSAVAEAVQMAYGPLGTVLGDIVTLVFIGFFLFNTAVYNYSFGRLLFVSGLDKRLPATVSKVNENRVPWVAVLVQTIIAAIITLVAFVLPYAFGGAGNAGALSTKVYDILQAAVTIIWCGPSGWRRERPSSPPNSSPHRGSATSALWSGCWPARSAFSSRSKTRGPR